MTMHELSYANDSVTATTGLAELGTDGDTTTHVFNGGSYFPIENQSAHPSDLTALKRLMEVATDIRTTQAANAVWEFATCGRFTRDEDAWQLYDRAFEVRNPDTADPCTAALESKPYVEPKQPPSAPPPILFCRLTS